MTIETAGRQLNIADGIRDFARAHPMHVAVVDGERRFTFAQVEDRARRLANHLLAAGMRPGERVGVLLGNRAEYVEIPAALGRIGMPMVPLNPRLTAPEAEYIFGHSEAVALILDDALSAVVAPVIEHARPRTVLSMDGATLGTDYERALAGAPSSDPSMAIPETEPFTVAYTSGTTGRPKGAMISHRSRALTAMATGLEWGLGPGRTTIAVAPMYHGAGFAFGYSGPFLGGTTWMLRAFDPEGVLAMAEASRASSFFLVPTHAQLIRALGEEAIARHDTSAIETLYFNAAPLPFPLKEWVMGTFPQVGVHELYGSTEGGVVTNLRPVDAARKPGSVGTAWYQTAVRLVDDEGNVLPPGGTGELFSRSPYLMNGYLKDDESTEACTTPDGFLSAGDIASSDEEGYLYIVDRKKDLIISGGVNVYPREVEDSILRHPDVRDAAVVGLPSERWGEEVSAFVVLAAGSSVPIEALEQHCRGELAGFKVPRQWRVVDALPRNAAGKVLKRELRDQHTAI